MRKFFVSFAMLFLLASIAQAGSLYRWVDKDGKVHYGDRPADDAVAAEQKKFSDTAGEVDLPYGVRKAMQDFPVTLYVAPNCAGLCVQARALLSKRGIPFSEKNIATKEDIESLRLRTGGDGTPALTVGRTPIIGFEAGQWNRELDIAGYPKSAPYGVRPVKAEPVKADTPPAAEE